MTEYPAQNPFNIDPALASRLAQTKEAVWFRIGVLQSTMNDRERALEAFERVLAVNPTNVRAMTQAGAVLAKKECYPQAVAYLQRAIQAEATCGEAWAVLAHCYVMTDELQKAYQAYQSALTHLPNPRDPNLWYGIGLLYDRYGSLDNALEAFQLVLSIAPDFERADEVCFCIGIIYKEQQNFDEALKFFNKVVVAANPPPPLTRADGWYQIGHVNELKRDIPAALDMYRHALAENPKHPKTLQNFGWLEHQHNNNSAEAIRLLKLSSELDATDGQTWYLLGRVYMALREFRSAYDAYQQAVYRDGRNATFWCSIGVLYYQMNQHRDAMDAYSRAIKLNPYVSEVWYDLGTLYESCAQSDDAIDAYRRAAELAPDNTQITERLSVLENSVAHGTVSTAHRSQALPTGTQQPAPSQPLQMQPEMHPSAQQHPHMSAQMNPLNPASGQPIQMVAQPKAPQPTSSLPPTQLPAPPHQLPSHHHNSLPQSRPTNIAAPLSAPHRNGQVEMAPIPTLRQPGIPEPQSAQHEQGFASQDGRPNLPPAPLSSIALPPQNANGGNHLSSMMSQAQPTHQLPPPSQLPSAYRDQLNPVDPHRSSPLPSHSQIRDDSTARTPHSQMSILRTTQPNHPPPGLSSPKQGQSIHSPKQDQKPGQSGTPQAMQDQNGQSSTYDPNAASRPQHPQVNQHAPQSPNQRPLNDHASHQTNQLPQIQPLPQIQGLSQLSHQPIGDQQDKREGQPQNSDRSNDVKDVRSGHGETGSDYKKFETHQRPDEPQLPNITRSDPTNEPTTGPRDSETNAPPNNSAPMSTHVADSSRDRLPPVREHAREPSSPSPAPRSMSMREITEQPDSRVDADGMDSSRRDSGSRHDEREQDRGPGVSNSHLDHGRQSDEKTERLPALSSLSGGLPLSSPNTREDAKLLQTVATPSLPLPSSASLPSLTDNGRPISSPTHGGSPTSAAGSGLVSNPPVLPPISSRNQSNCARMSHDGKDMGSSGGVSSGMGLGSSLTRLRTNPTTPVSNSVVPSSLPSPLPSRKGTGGILGSSNKSPHLPKPSSGPGFKPSLVGSQSYGQVESVPSPGSLPVLPALPSLGHGNDDKNKEKRGFGEQEMRNERDGSSMSGGNEKSDKEGERERNEEVMGGKPMDKLLTPTSEKEMDRSDRDEKMKSPVGQGPRLSSENVVTGKRDGSKEEIGRTPKRPRLHDMHDKDEVNKGYYDRSDDTEKMKDADGNESEERGRIKTEVGSLKEMKSERKGSSSQDTERDKRASGDGEMKGSLGSGMMELPRLSGKLSGPPPISGNTPLPTFRSERLNLSTSKTGSGSVGKLSSEGGQRALPYPLRSAPAPPLGTGLKGLGGSSGRGGERGERGDYSPPVLGENGSSSKGGDEKDGSMIRGGNRDRDEGGHGHGHGHGGGSDGSKGGESGSGGGGGGSGSDGGGGGGNSGGNGGGSGAGGDGSGGGGGGSGDGDGVLKEDKGGGGRRGELRETAS